MRQELGLLHGIPDKAVCSLVSRPLQLQSHVLESDLCVAGGWVIMAAHVHVVHDAIFPQVRVHQRFAHQPICEVACSRHLQQAPQ